MWQGREMMRNPLMGDQFSPARIEKGFHAVAGFADWRIVLVERDTIDKHQLQIGTKVVPCLVTNSFKKLNKDFALKLTIETYTLSLSFLRMVLRSIGDRMIFL